GSVLEQWDEEAGRKRDDLLATGLPRRGNSSSRDRFLAQFLARVTRGGEAFPGAACQYGLVRFDGGLVGLTDRGLEFAALGNPVLDRQATGATWPLTEEEAEFLARHVLAHVPAERDDMRLVLSAVTGGSVTPKGLLEAVRGGLPGAWNDSAV